MPSNAAPSQAAPRLFLIRHGETAWSLTGQHTGRTDIPLIDDGRASSRWLTDRLARETFARVFTSPLQRARETCAIAGFESRAEVDQDLVEWDYGRFDGLTSEQIREIQPDWHLYRDGGPGGESPAEATARADRVLERFRLIEADVAAFTSGHLARLLAARWTGVPVVQANVFYTSVASVGVLGYEHGRDDRVVRSWNERPF